MSARYAVFFALALACASSNALADDDCRLSRLATLDIGTENPQRIIVPVTLNDHQIPVVLDTGAPTSMLLNNEANDLGLDRQMFAVGFEYKMLNGTRVRDEAIAPTFLIGGMKGTNFRFGILPDRFIEPPAVGLLGADIARNYDVELDFAQNKMILFARHHCRGRVVYWTKQPFAVLPFHFDPGHHMVADVKLDGVSLTAIVDTGAPPAVSMPLPLARREFSWSDDPAQLHRIAGKHSPYTYPFGVLSLDGASVHQPTVWLSESNGGIGPDALVGLAALRAFHVYISYEDQAIYLTARDAR
ncbi:MAG TPA: aspartyl protease family protein [Rhizomicrobium sp.]|nr:aspartyl protease family protein [Rhizomicrobium sp.]